MWFRAFLFRAVSKWSQTLWFWCEGIFKINFFPCFFIFPLFRRIVVQRPRWDPMFGLLQGAIKPMFLRVRIFLNNFFDKMRVFFGLVFFCVFS